MTTFNRKAAHLAQLAMTPGFWQYARTACSDLENDRGYHGLFIGLRAAVGALVKAQGYRPAQHELGELQ